MFRCEPDRKDYSNLQRERNIGTKCRHGSDAGSVEVTHRLSPPKPVLVEGLPIPCIGGFQLDDKAVSHFCPGWCGAHLQGFSSSASDSLKEIRKEKWNRMSTAGWRIQLVTPGHKLGGGSSGSEFWTPRQEGWFDRGG